MAERQLLKTIGIKKNVFIQLNKMRATGQSYSGFIEELLTDRKKIIKRSL